MAGYSASSVSSTRMCPLPPADNARNWGKTSHNRSAFSLIPSPVLFSVGLMSNADCWKLVGELYGSDVLHC